MLKALAIRQAFLLVDILLTALVLLVAFLVIMAVFETDTGLSSGGLDRIAPHDLGNAFSHTGPREDYNTLATGGLFGDAGRANSPEPEPPPEVSAEVAESELHLKLQGTSTANPRVASAVILNETERKSGTFFLGDEVVPRVTLEEIRDWEVILLNQNTNRREVLRREENARFAVASASRRGGNIPSPAPGGVVEVDKNRFIEEVSANYPKLITTLAPELKKDSGGRVIGITSKNLGRIPMAKELGLRDNDVVQRVNGVAIDSQQKIIEIAERFQNASTIRLRVLRDGKAQTITYRLK